jgi:PilZ domain
MKRAYVKPMIRSRPLQPGDIEAGARFAQKRSVPRYPFAARAVILEPLSRREFAGRTSDISLKGCFIESVDQFPTKTIVQIKLELTGESFNSWARVAHVRAPLGAGLSFFNTSPGQQIILEKWVKEAVKSANT